MSLGNKNPSDERVPKISDAALRVMEEQLIMGNEVIGLLKTGVERYMKFNDLVALSGFYLEKADLITNTDCFFVFVQILCYISSDNIDLNDVFCISAIKLLEVINSNKTFGQYSVFCFQQLLKKMECKNGKWSDSLIDVVISSIKSSEKLLADSFPIVLKVFEKYNGSGHFHKYFQMLTFIYINRKALFDMNCFDINYFGFNYKNFNDDFLVLIFEILKLDDNAQIINWLELFFHELLNDIDSHSSFTQKSFSREMIPNYKIGSQYQFFDSNYQPSLITFSKYIIDRSFFYRIIPDAILERCGTFFCGFGSTNERIFLRIADIIFPNGCDSFVRCALMLYLVSNFINHSKYVFNERVLETIIFQTKDLILNNDNDLISQMRSYYLVLIEKNGFSISKLINRYNDDPLFVLELICRYYSNCYRSFIKSFTEKSFQNSFFSMYYSFQVYSINAKIDDVFYYRNIALSILFDAIRDKSFVSDLGFLDSLRIICYEKSVIPTGTCLMAHAIVRIIENDIRNNDLVIKYVNHLFKSNNNEEEIMISQYLLKWLSELCYSYGFVTFYLKIISNIIILMSFKKDIIFDFLRILSIVHIHDKVYCLDDESINIVSEGIKHNLSTTKLQYYFLTIIGLASDSNPKSHNMSFSFTRPVYLKLLFLVFGETSMIDTVFEFLFNNSKYSYNNCIAYHESSIDMLYISLLQSTTEKCMIKFNDIKVSKPNNAQIEKYIIPTLFNIMKCISDKEIIRCLFSILNENNHSFIIIKHHFLAFLRETTRNINYIEYPVFGKTLKCMELIPLGGHSCTLKSSHYPLTVFKESIGIYLSFILVYSLYQKCLSITNRFIEVSDMQSSHIHFTLVKYDLKISAETSSVSCSHTIPSFFSLNESLELIDVMCIKVSFNKDSTTLLVYMGSQKRYRIIFPAIIFRDKIQITIGGVSTNAVKYGYIGQSYIGFDVGEETDLEQNGLNCIRINKSFDFDQKSQTMLMTPSEKALEYLNKNYVLHHISDSSNIISVITKIIESINQGYCAFGSWIEILQHQISQNPSVKIDTSLIKLLAKSIMISNFSNSFKVFLCFYDSLKPLLNHINGVEWLIHFFLNPFVWKSNNKDFGQIIRFWYENLICFSSIPDSLFFHCFEMVLFFNLKSEFSESSGFEYSIFLNNLSLIKFSEKTLMFLVSIIATVDYSEFHSIAVNILHDYGQEIISIGTKYSVNIHNYLLKSFHQYLLVNGNGFLVLFQSFSRIIGKGYVDYLPYFARIVNDADKLCGIDEIISSDELSVEAIQLLLYLAPYKLSYIDNIIMKIQFYRSIVDASNWFFSVILLLINSSYEKQDSVIHILSNVFYFIPDLNEDVELIMLLLLLIDSPRPVNERILLFSFVQYLVTTESTYSSSIMNFYFQSFFLDVKSSIHGLISNNYTSKDLFFIKSISFKSGIAINPNPIISDQKIDFISKFSYYLDEKNRFTFQAVATSKTEQINHSDYRMFENRIKQRLIAMQSSLNDAKDKNDSLSKEILIPQLEPSSSFISFIDFYTSVNC